MSSGGGDSPRLLDQVREVIRMRHYSIRTEEAYVQWIRRFILFHGKRHPREMGAPELTAFLSDLAMQHSVAASTQNQALHAILFLYRDVLKLDLPWLDEVQRAKKPQRLPVVFTRDEVKALLARLEGTTWLMAMLTYGSGLRLLECLRLRVKDIDFHYKQLVVRDAKGQKDRVTMLPNSLIDPLRTHLARVRQLHEADLRDGFGRVWLSHALAAKYPNADREWGWQYAFPSSRRSIDPRSGTERRHHAAAFVRDAPPRVGLRHSHRAGIARARGREDHDDLHACLESRWARSGQPC
jgi:integron integrase